MQLTNPLYYPVAVLAGGITLVIGVRFLQLSSAIAAPVAIGVTVVGATYLKSRQPELLSIENPELARELQTIRAAAVSLAAKSNDLRSEATKLLTNSWQMELLAAVQLSCDRALELPSKIDELARRLQGSDSILSVDELQRQLTEIQYRLRSSSGATEQHLNRLAASLKRNIELAREGHDTRLAQILSLSTIVQDAAGVLQKLQNQLRTVSLTDSGQIDELQSLNDELASLQENFDLLVYR